MVGSTATSKFAVPVSSSVQIHAEIIDKRQVDATVVLLLN
jgi:hypothetical protein